MTNDYSTEADLVGDAMEAVFENKQVNKKNNISGDFSSDSESYPTAHAVQTELAKKVNTSDIEDSLTSSSASKVLSAKQGKALDEAKVDKVQSTANRLLVTDSSKNVSLQEKLGNITLDGKIGSNSGKIITTTTNGVLTTSDHLGADKITDPNAEGYASIGSLSSDATQQQINSAINSKLADILGLKFIEITTDKGTASADTMGKLFIEVGANETGVFYTVSSGSGNNITYDWEDLESDILEDVSISWNDITGKPTIIAQSDVDTSISDFATALADRINPSTP